MLSYGNYYSNDSSRIRLDSPSESSGLRLDSTLTDQEKDSSFLNISSDHDTGVSMTLMFEPALLQRMAVNIGSLFFGPELDSDFSEYTDSGHWAQVTNAVVVDTL